MNHRPVVQAPHHIEMLREAMGFFANNFDEMRRERLEEIIAEISEKSMYRHTDGELALGAKLAWRNHSRCIGRLQWQSLVVADERSCVTAAEVFEACLRHIRRATNGGQIRPMITIFSPGNPDGGCQYRI